MISPELLRRYPFFGTLSDAELKLIAMITNEAGFPQGAILFQEGQPADMLYFLVEGSVALYYIVEEPYHPDTRKEFMVGEINPGEVFAISSLIDPFLYTSTARMDKPSRVLQIHSGDLRNLLATNCTLGYKVMCQIAQAAINRLGVARILLAGNIKK